MGIGELCLAVGPNVALAVHQRDHRLPQCLRTRQLVATHLAGRQATCLTQPVDPTDRCADADPELLGGLIARLSAALNRSNDPFPKLQWVRLAHAGLHPSQHGESETR